MVIPLLVLGLAGFVKYMLTAEAPYSKEMFADRLRYDAKGFAMVRSLLGFVTADEKQDRVARDLTKLFAEENVAPITISAHNTNAMLLEYAVENSRDYNYNMLFGAIFKGNSTVGNSDHKLSIENNSDRTACAFQHSRAQTQKQRGRYSMDESACA